MKQTLHIFAKDARRFWPEIAISLAITALFARIYPNQWLAQAGLYAVSGWGGFAGPPGVQLLAFVLYVLVPVGWWLLIARVVHGENLVGDRQFWVTRPYEWKQLLAAKVLFLFVFLYLPFVTAQLVLLAEAGFQPFSYIPGLLYDLLLLTGAVIMPLFAMATVTSAFARMALAMVGVLLGFIGFMVLSSHLATTAVSTPSGANFSTPILLCICGGAVAVQYAARRLWLSRLLLIGLFLTIGVAMLAPSDGGAVDRAFAARATSQESPIHIAFLQDANHQVTGAPLGDKRVQINIPVLISGIADGIVIMPQNVKVSGGAADGAQWSTPWQSIYGSHYASDTQDSNISFMMDRSVYEKVKSAPIHLQLTLALTQGQAGGVTRIPLPTTDFSVPGFGVCSPQKGWPETSSQITGISCRSAFRQPYLTYVETLWSNLPCSGAKTEPNNGVQGAAWVGDFDNALAQFSIASVSSVLVSLSNSLRETGVRDRQEPRYLCPGTPVTFTRYNLVRLLRTEVVIPNFQMPTKVTPEGYAQATP
jgi:hypothetical protein